MKGDDDAPAECNAARSSGKPGTLLDSSSELEENNGEGDAFCVECEDQAPEIICLGCSNEVGGVPPLYEKISMQSSLC